MRGRGQIELHPSQSLSLREFAGWVKRPRGAHWEGISRCGARQNSIVEKDFSAGQAGLTRFRQPGILELALHRFLSFCIPKPLHSSGSFLFRGPRGQVLVRGVEVRATLHNF